MSPVFLALAVLLTPTFGNSQDCSCDRVIPYSGTYRIGFPEKKDLARSETASIAVIDGTEPGEIINMSQLGRTMDIVCSGSVYEGLMQPMNQPFRLAGASSEPSGMGGLRMGDKFQGFVIRPGLVAIANEETTPTLEFTLISGDRKANPLMCKTIRNSIQSAKVIQQTFADPDLIAKAEAAEMAGGSNKEWSTPDLERPDKYKSEVTETYHELVRARYKTLLAFLSPSQDKIRGAVAGGQPQGTDSNPVQAAQALALQGNGIAETDSYNCAIFGPRPTNRDGTCVPEIELIAIKKHEEVHKKRCEKLNEDYVTNDPYARWSNHPSNYSLNEVEAYQAALDVMEPWYEEFCE